MATLEDILAATEILDDNSGNPTARLGSGTEENRIVVSDEKKDEGSAATVDVRGKIVETETVVESTLDSNSSLDNMEKDNNGVNALSRASNGGAFDSAYGINNGVDGGVMRDEKVNGEECSFVDNGGSRGSDYKKSEVTKRKTLHVVVDGCESAQSNGEILENLDQGFHVGDFVWGKVKSHPWWPGQIYDLTTASEFAVKHNQEGRLLVAFFGDGSCSWCIPSQLKPFVENFREMFVDSTAKSFINAVQRAVDEVGRLVESEMTCGCVPSDKRDGLSRQVVLNAGVKEGVLAPEVDICRLSVPEYKPSEILSEVMNFAKAVSFGSVLEVAVLKSWISAFYRAKGGCRLPVYHEPLLIEGMEDKSETVTKVVDDFSVPTEVPIMGPQEEDWLLSSPTATSKKPQSSPDDKVYYRRKQKSVADLMRENSNANAKSREGTTTKNGKYSGKSVSTRNRKSDMGELAGGGNGTLLASSIEKMGRKRKAEILESPKTAAGGNSSHLASSTEKMGRQRKVESLESPETAAGGNGTKLASSTEKMGRKRKVETLELPKTAAGGNGSQLASSTKKMGRKREVEILESPKTAAGGIGTQLASSTEKMSRKREVEIPESPKTAAGGSGTRLASSIKKMGRKRNVEILESPKTAAEVVNAKDDGTGNGIRKGTSPKKPMKIEVPPVDTTCDEAGELGIVSTPRERKKSKYLCPPYTSPRSRLGNSSFKMEIESEKSPKLDWEHEHMKKAASADLSSSGPVTKVVDKSSDKKVTDGHKKRIKANPETVENRKKVPWNASDVNVPVHELLSDLQCAAVDHLYLSKEGTLDPIWEFISVLRNSTYLHGPDYKLYQKSTTGRNRKSLPFLQEKSLANEKVKSGSKKTDASKSKKAMMKPHRNASVCLILTVAPAFPLPSKELVVETFTKFGSLNEKETCLLTDTHSVKIVYTKGTDAETALKSSVSNKPFGAENVINYSLQHYSLDVSNSSHKQISNKPESSFQPQSDDFLMDIRVIRQKFDILTAILENCNSRFSDKDKCGLKDDMKILLENLEKLSEKAREVAEKSSS